MNSTQGGASKDTASSLPSFSLTGTAGEADKVLPVLPKILSLIEQLKQTLSKPGVGDYIRGGRHLHIQLRRRQKSCLIGAVLHGQTQTITDYYVSWRISRT